MHVHVGMPDPETAIRAYNGLRRHLPLLQALAANSPFRDDRDAGVQSARVLAMRAWVRTGVPRALRDYDEWLEMSERLVRATALPDYTFFWWKIRPHPRLGTVEVRTMDTQTSLEDTAALAALVHALARHEARGPRGRRAAPRSCSTRRCTARRATAWTARCPTPTASCARSERC